MNSTTINVLMSRAARAREVTFVTRAAEEQNPLRSAQQASCVRMGFPEVTVGLLSLSAILMLTSAAIPEGWVVEVVPHCGSNGNASISVHTDLSLIRATAGCANGVYEFQHFALQSDLVVSYPPSDTNNCVFFKRAKKDVYYISVFVVYGEPAGEVQQVQETYTVTCTFTPHADNHSFQHHVIEGLIAPKELQNLKGPSSDVPISLILTDVLGHDITGTAIKMGRTVQIKLEATNASDILGIYPLSCDAISDVKRYAILRAGCGDGVVFKKSAGFTTSGLVSRSPYFKAFAVGQSTDLKIQCNVSMCVAGCDGDACTNQRRRRSAESEGGRGYIVVATATQRLVQAPLHLDVAWNNIEQNGPTYSADSVQERPYHVFGSVQQRHVSDPDSSTLEEPPDGHRVSADTKNTSNTTGPYSQDVTSNVETSTIPGRNFQTTNASGDHLVGKSFTDSGNKSLVPNKPSGSIQTVHTGFIGISSNYRVSNKAKENSSDINVIPPKNDSPAKEKPKINTPLTVESGRVYVKELLGIVVNGTNVLNSEISNDSISVTNNTKGGNYDELSLFGGRPLYIVGLAIAAVFSLASLVLGIHLYRNQRKSV